MVRYEIAKQKAVDAWLDSTTPRPDPAGAPVTAEVDRLRDAARVGLRAEARQTYVGARAQSSRTSMLFDILQDKSACAGCQAWRNKILHNS